jgi:hypothetical protein
MRYVQLVTVFLFGMIAGHYVGAWEVKTLRTQLQAERELHTEELVDYSKRLIRAQTDKTAGYAQVAEETASNFTKAIEVCEARIADYRKELTRERERRQEAGEHWRQRFLEQVNIAEGLKAQLRGAQ